MTISLRSRKLLSGFKTPPNRRIVILLPSDDEVGRRESRRLADTLYDDKDLIGERFEVTIQTLRKLSRRRFPQFGLAFDRRGVQNRTLTELLNHHEDASGIRAIIDFAVLPPVGKTTSRNAAISHLVSVTIADDDAGWHVSSEPTDVVVKTTLAKVGTLIQDIALDIAMTHSHSDKLDESILGRPLSRAKAEFAVHRKLRSFYGDLTDPQIRYFSLAAAVRRAQTFSVDDCKQYDDLWSEFLEWLHANRPARPASRKKKNRLDAIGDLLQRHKRFGQLPLHRIQHEVAALPPGDYFLLVAMRQPQNASLRGQMLAMFGKRKWKTNAWRIVSAGPMEAYVPLTSYVSVFPLHLEED